MQRHFWSTFVFTLAVGAASAHAHPQHYEQLPPPMYEPEEDERLPPRVYFELFGNWGVNLGQTEYIPDGEPGESKHPFANGFGAGGTIGTMILPERLSMFVDYRYGRASTREGEIDGVLERAQGKVSFHELTMGLRLQHFVGDGDIYAQLGLGILFPFHTTREIEYAPELAAIGLVGEGTEERNFGIGFGGQAELGYHHDLSPGLYIGTGIRISAMQSNNAGKETERENFVVDFSGVPPMPVTGSIESRKGGPVTPTTYSIQDVRLNVTLGLRF